MGTLSPEEEAKIKKDIREEFDKIDTDKSGMIDKNELRNLLEKIAKKMGEPLKEKNVDETFDQLDKDKSGKISFEEVFAQWAGFSMLIGLSK